MIVLPRQPPTPDMKLPPMYPTPIASPAQAQVQPASFSPPSSRASCSDMTSNLERLPNELQRFVFSYLDYQSLIHLSTMNRHFHQHVKPQEMADPIDKFQFVMRAVKDFPQHRPSEKGQDHQPGNYECYICFRVRSPDHFDTLQAHSTYIDMHGRVVSDREPGPSDRLVPLRRFCIPCGVQFGLHAPFDCLTTKAGQDLWVCRCRKLWQKPDTLKCGDCGGSCPLRPKRKW